MSARQPETVNPSNVPAPRPTYSQVATYTLPRNAAAKVVTVAGQVGIDAQSGTTPEAFEAQVQTALENLEKCLASVGATKRDIMKVNQYVVGFDMAKRSPAPIYLKWIDDHKPASTLVPVTALAAPEWLYEIDAMAIISDWS